jgi:hypothetical protein
MRWLNFLLTKSDHSGDRHESNGVKIDTTMLKSLSLNQARFLGWLAAATIASIRNSPILGGIKSVSGGQKWALTEFPACR